MTPEQQLDKDLANYKKECIELNEKYITRTELDEEKQSYINNQ